MHDIADHFIRSKLKLSQDDSNQIVYTDNTKNDQADREFYGKGIITSGW